MKRLGAIVRRETFDRRTLVDPMTELVDDLFRPLVEIVATEEDVATLRLRGGEFATVDPDRPQLRPGDVLQPFYRHLDRQGELRQITPLPWTALVVESVAGEFAKARIATGVRVALGAKRSPTVELQAIVVRGVHPQTTLTLAPRGDRTRPLVAHPVAVLPFQEEPRAPIEPAAENAEQDHEAAPRPAEPPPLRRLLSDRNGRVVIPQEESHPIVWLQVFSGGQLLAKVPFVPGAVATETLELPDDSLRLSVEGEMELLKGRLVDVVARRATFIARTRVLAKSEDWKGVDELLKQIEMLPKVKDFEIQVANVRVPALEEAAKRKDRLLEARIRQLTGDAEQLVRRYLDPEKLKELREELAELRSLDLKSELKGRPEK